MTARKTCGTALKIRAHEGIDLERLTEYAELYASVEDAAALLDINAPALRDLIDKPGTAAARIWRQGRAQARLNLRRAQFAQIGKNATLAIYLGKEILGQDGAAPAGPVTYVIETGIRRDGTDTH